MGLPPGFHLTGGRGISMCATVHSCFASLHRAKATGRPRSTSRFPLPVKTYWSSTSRSKDIASDTRSWITSWRSRRVASTTTSSMGATCIGCSVSATTSGTSPSSAVETSGASRAASSSWAAGSSAVMTGSPSSGALCVVAHAAQSIEARTARSPAACLMESQFTEYLYNGPAPENRDRGRAAPAAARRSSRFRCRASCAGLRRVAPAGRPGSNARWRALPRSCRPGYRQKAAC